MRVGAACAGFAPATQASAHIKWFCAFDVAGQPRGLENVLCSQFESLTSFAMACLLVGALVEQSSLGGAVLRAINSATAIARSNTEILIRAVCGFFLVSIWAVGNIILTPELTTNSAIVPVIQLATAACLIWRSTLVFSAVGIIALFAAAVAQYGVFHLMDYPVFLGLAAYLALSGTGRSVLGWTPLDILRASASITLMWASIEKWAYPEWSFPLFIVHPEITMGYSEESFMRAAGVVEFALAFALLWTPLVRKVAAAILVGMFVGAIGPFGKIDAIGHAPIIAALVAVVCEAVEERRPRVRDVAMVGPAFGGALALFLIGYYELHATMFGTTVL